MPIKKRLSSTESAQPTAKPAKKVAPRKPITQPTPAKKAAPKGKVDLGPSPDPANQPGANEKADSLLGQVWKFTVKFSTGGTNTFLFGFLESSTKAAVNWRWRQRGAAMAFENAAGFARYTGRLQDGEGSGEGGNRDGVTWTWTATLVPDGKLKESVYQDADYAS